MIGEQLYLTYVILTYRYFSLSKEYFPNVSALFLSKINCFDFLKGKDYYSFPTIDALAGIKKVVDSDDGKDEITTTQKAQNNDSKKVENIEAKLRAKSKDTFATKKAQNKGYENKEQDIEMELRQLGFGYRAKFIHKVAQTISEKDDGVEWLFGLKQFPYQDAHSGK